MTTAFSQLAGRAAGGDPTSATLPLHRHHNTKPFQFQLAAAPHSAPPALLVLFVEKDLLDHRHVVHRLTLGTLPATTYTSNEGAIRWR